MLPLLVESHNLIKSGALKFHEVDGSGLYQFLRIFDFGFEGLGLVGFRAWGLRFLMIWVFLGVFVF